MKINKQDEYGLRVLLRIARSDSEDGLSIPQLSELEGMSQPYVAKITRSLRMAGFIQSTHGQKGGYILAKAADQITLKDVIHSLGGKLFYQDFCGSHAGYLKLCTHSVDCTIRSLWKILQTTIDHILEKITLQDLLGNEQQADQALEDHIDAILEKEGILNP